MDHGGLVALVAIRLVLPWSIESILSLIPSRETFPETFVYGASPQLQSGISGIDHAVGPVITQSLTPAPGASANPTQIWSALLSWAWAIGVRLMLLYALVSWLLLKWRMSDAVRFRGNIFQSDRAVSPFVLGFFRPRIYMPYQISPEDMEQVVAHEQAHIRRRDHWWKPLGFVLLSVFWFHPLLWAAYILFCRDIEAACDEKVIEKLSHAQRQAYSLALLNCAVHHRAVAACPLAFGEVGVKERVKSVMHYKRPAFWVILAGLLIGVTVALCFLTDPMGSRIVNPWVQEYVPGQPGIRGSVDKAAFESRSDDFAIGADEYGRAVFKDPYKAFDTFTELYADAISLIRQENDLPPISRGEYSLYKKFGWQLTSGTVEEHEAARFVTRFLDIYENSFLKDPPAPGGDVLTTQEPRTLTLNEVIVLSQKGYDLTWADFDPFLYEDGGFGLMIRNYGINSLYRLSIADREGAPFYIHLTYIPTGEYIDIRDGGVTEFLSRNREYPEELEYVQFTSRRMVTSVSLPRELDEVWTYLKELKPKLKYLEKLPQLETILLDHWNNIRLTVGYGDRSEELSVSHDGRYIWTQREEKILVYSVPDPEELLAFLDRWMADVNDEAVTGEPFATMEEPWKWTAGISLDAAEEASAYVMRTFKHEGKASHSGASSGHFTQERFEELVKVLNGLPRSAFTRGNIQWMTFSEFYHVQINGMSVRVTDSLNGLVAAIRCRFGELEMALFSDMEKIHSGEATEVQIWKIEDEALMAFMVEIAEHPPVTIRFVGSSYEWTDEVVYDFEGGSMSLRIIQDWEYEIVEETEHFGIRCRPQAVDQGWIYYSFWPGGYFPEETDDRYYSKGHTYGVETVRSYPGSVSPDGISFDVDNAVWSYYRIPFDGFDFVEINDGADEWFLEYKDEIFATEGLMVISVDD